MSIVYCKCIYLIFLWKSITMLGTQWTRCKQCYEERTSGIGVKLKFNYESLRDGWTNITGLKEMSTRQDVEETICTENHWNTAVTDWLLNSVFSWLRPLPSLIQGHTTHRHTHRHRQKHTDTHIHHALVKPHILLKYKYD